MNEIKLTLTQVAEATGFCYQKIWNDVKNKKLVTEKKGRQHRVSQNNLNKYIENCKQ